MKNRRKLIATSNPKGSDKSQVTSDRLKTKEESGDSLLEKGFTLLELIIVLFMITLILGLSAIFFAGTSPSNRINAAARDLSATLRYARNLSITSGQQKTIALNIDAKRFGFEGGRSRELSSGIDMKVIDPLYGDVHQGIYRIAFEPDGGMPGGTVVLWNKKREVRITLDPVIGAAVIK